MLLCTTIPASHWMIPLCSTRVYFLFCSLYVLTFFILDTIPHPQVTLAADALSGLIQCDYSWPSISTYVCSYVAVCDQCHHIKTPQHKPFGLLCPLEIPDCLFCSITMDNIIKLLLSHSYNLIWVVCGHLTRYTHFISCNELLDAPGLTWLFLNHIFHYHSLPDTIVSDGGSTFILHF